MNLDTGRERRFRLADGVRRRLSADGRPLLSGSLWTFAGLGTDYAVGFALSLLLAQQLGPGGYGELSLVFAACDVPRMLASSALGTAAAVKIATARGSEEQSPQSLMNGTLVAFVLYAAIVASIFVVAAGWLAQAFGQPELEGEFRLASLVLLSACALYYASAIYQGWQEISRFGQSHIFASVGRLLATGVLLVGFGLGVTGGIAGSAIGLGIAAVIMIGGAARRWSLFSPSEPVNWRPIVRYGLPLTVSWIAFFAYTRVDLIILGLFTNDQTELGYFAFAAAVSVVPYIGVQAAVASIGPHVARHWTNGRRDAVTGLLFRTLRYAVTGYVPLAAAVAILVGPLVSSILPMYVGAAPLVAILAIAIVPRSLGTLSAGGFLTPSGRAATVARITAVAAAANVALDFALIPWLGALGSVIGTAAVHSCAGIIGLVIATRTLGIPLGWMRPALAKSIVLTVPMGAVMLACVYCLPVHPALKLTSAIVLGGLVLIMGVWALKPFRESSDHGEIGAT